MTSKPDRLLKDDEWVSARAGERTPDMPASYLPLEGVPGLRGVDVPTEVAMLFTPHNECQEEFKVEPGRGKLLLDHLSRAFVVASKSQQRLRWVQKCRQEPQKLGAQKARPLGAQVSHALRLCTPENERRGPLRVHQDLVSSCFIYFQGMCARCGGRRCVEKRGQEPVAPEVVMLLGPPAAGKSSIQRLSLDEMPSAIQGTAKSLRFREEVSNDNLCAPRCTDEKR